MARNNHLGIYQEAYRFCREIFKLKQKMPKLLKYDLGEKIGHSCLIVLRNIVIANGSKDKAKALNTIALEIDALWVYLRLAHDLEGISRGEFQVTSELLYEISKQNQNWLAWAKKNPASNTPPPTAKGPSSP